jgi:hypothetical protein
MSFRHKSALGSKKSKRQTTPTSDNLLPTPLNRNQTTRKEPIATIDSRHPTINSHDTTTDTRQPTKQPTTITYRKITPNNQKRHQTPDSCLKNMKNL